MTEHTTELPAYAIDTTGGEGPLWSFPVGDVTVFALREMDFFPDPAHFFPQLETTTWTDGAFYTREPFLHDSRIRLNQQAHLLKTPDRLILVDAAGGNDKQRNSPQFDQQHRGWLDQFARAGVSIDDVDTVVFTHLHVDHVGFATSLERDGKWRPTFPNARYVLARKEYEFWTSEQGRQLLVRTGDYITDSIEPLREHGVLDLVEADHVVSPEVSLVPAFGHTPGNVYVVVESAGVRALFAGDMMHHGVQLERPDWSIRYCVLPHDSADQRRALLERAADSGDLLVPAHFPWPSAGHVERAGDGFTFRFIEP